MILFKKQPLEQRVYTTIFELPLSVFLDVVCDNKFLSLIKQGKKATDIECQDQWKIIFEEYLNLIKDKDATYINKLELRIEQYRRKIYLVNSCAAYLRGSVQALKMGVKIDSFAEIIAIIKKESQTNGAFNISNLEQFENDIKAAETSIIRYQLELDAKKAELNIIMPEKSEPATRESFMSILVKMSLWAKVQYRVNEITVYEFVKNLNIWKEEIAQINLANNKKKR